MNYYLVDYENVKSDAIKDLKGARKDDAIVLFYSEQCKNISLDVVDRIMSLGMKYTSYKAKVGTKNALDFQLCSHLGYLIGQGGKNAKYYIVSNDKGYDCLCDYWKELGTSVERIASTAETKPAKTKQQAAKQQAPKKSKVQAADLATLEEVSALLEPDDQPAEALQIVNQYKTKLAINNALAKYYKDSKRASAVYKKLKPLLKQKNKS